MVGATGWNGCLRVLANSLPPTPEPLDKQGPQVETVGWAPPASVAPVCHAEATSGFGCFTPKVDVAISVVTAPSMAFSLSWQVVTDWPPSSPPWPSSTSATVCRRIGPGEVDAGAITPVSELSIIGAAVERVGTTGGGLSSERVPVVAFLDIFLLDEAGIANFSTRGELVEKSEVDTKKLTNVNLSRFK